MLRAHLNRGTVHLVTTQGTLLIDGLWNATWKISQGFLEIAPFLPLTSEDSDAIAAEGARLLAFAGVEAGIRFRPPECAAPG